MTTQRVCTYCPQTCYQTAYRQVPVTVYRPVTACDPCTGCPVTTMQACTTTTVQAYRVPVTTYRQVCRDVTVPVAPAVAAPVAYPQAVPQYGVATPGCSSCGGHAAPAYAMPQAAATYAIPQTAPTYATPTPQLGPVITPIPGPAASPTTGLAPMQGGDASSYQSTPADTTPVLPQTQIPQSQPTYNPSSLRHETYQPQPRVSNPELRPLPDLERTNERTAPPLLNPNPNDRTAQRAVPVGAIVPIEWAANRTPAAPVVPRTDSRGWRPSR
jgi:hypothetical protein